ncbi:MAG: hypothetical protein ACI9R3_005239 [Verrucomicrobiales bacterium]|jgi:hypothetical protein
MLFHRRVVGCFQFAEGGRPLSSVLIDSEDRPLRTDSINA